MPVATHEYLMAVNPGPFLVQEQPPFMHGFVFGNAMVISLEVQLQLEKLLTRREHGEGSPNPEGDSGRHS